MRESGWKRGAHEGTSWEKKTPLGWAWEKIHVGGAKLVWQGRHNFGSNQVRMLFSKHSWHFPDCVSKRLTAFENSGLSGISRLRVAYSQTQEQRAARFHDLREGRSLVGGSDDWINAQGVHLQPTKDAQCSLSRSSQIGDNYEHAFYLQQRSQSLHCNYETR